MSRIVQVRLRESGAVVWFNAGEADYKSGACVIVEAERGVDYGYVISESKATPTVEAKTEENLRKIVRLASEADSKQIDENRAKTKEAIATCQKKIEERKLDMKLVDAEYSFDRTKIIFYFTAEGRIDLRDLVKDLARIFKARIELRQIGVRDEAKLFGGFGSCGRELCCAKFLKDFEPVSIRMAKEQGLPLNPPKISGVCGRLMCCLSYEFETYKFLAKDLPKEGEKINTPEGKGKVISVNVLKRKIRVEVGQGQDTKIIEMIYK
ncbi:MAG: stage 0 sporulation family protein [Candidatus Omnitrophota bacterium]|nr:stage 0 sporulation family protein [Candidatus Omnitrophota bacterium]